MKPPVEMTKVDSSNVQEVGYDPEAQALHVKFKSGGYVYHDVPRETYDGIMAADSKGQHLRQALGQYKFSRIS